MNNNKILLLYFRYNLNFEKNQTYLIFEILSLDSILNRMITRVLIKHQDIININKTKCLIDLFHWAHTHGARDVRCPVKQLYIKNKIKEIWN